MHADEWNQSDILELSLYSPLDPLAQGFEGLERVLTLIESLDEELRPDSMSLLKRRLKYSRQTLRKRLHEVRIGKATYVSLSRSHFPEVYWWLTSFEGNEDARFSLELRVTPFSLYRESGKAQARTRTLLDFVRSLAAYLPLSYGMVHSNTDYLLGLDLEREDRWIPRQVDAVYWLNVYGARLVEAIGRGRLHSTPAAHMEELPHGALLWLSRPTPADFHSPEARLAQARALVHLRPELKLEDTLAPLRQRSLAFTPLTMDFDPDVAEILLQKVEMNGLYEKRKLVERFNAYRPPPVSEWLPAAHAPWPDVPDAKAVIDTYEALYAEQLVALLYKELPSTAGFRSPEALPRLDFHLWRTGLGWRMDPEAKETLIPALGAYLGFLLVHTLGGKWVPRRNLDEAAVIIGDRAWLPFLRARHSLQGEQEALDFSLTQLFRTAQRLRG